MRPAFGDNAVRQLHLQVTHQRRFQAAEQGVHAFLYLVLVVDVGKAAAPELGGAGHEVAVGGGADAHGEQAGFAELLVQGPEDTVLVAHGAVGDKDHLAQITVAGVLAQGGAEGG